MNTAKNLGKLRDTRNRLLERCKNAEAELARAHMRVSGEEMDSCPFCARIGMTGDAHQCPMCHICELESTLQSRLARADKAEAELAEWRLLRAWGGTPAHVDVFIKGQQERIYAAQLCEAENAELRKELCVERQARTNAEFKLLALENPIPPEVRAKMDAARAKAIAAREAGKGTP